MFGYSMVSPSLDFNMASAVNFAGSFTGSKNDHIGVFLKKVELLGEMFELKEEKLIKVAILCFREDAADWAAHNKTIILSKDWKSFIKACQGRFCDDHIADNALQNIMTSSVPTTYEQYINLLQKADVCVKAEAISFKYIQRIIISKSMVDIRSYLFQALEANLDWEKFRKRCEESAWYVFTAKMDSRSSKIDNVDHCTTQKYPTVENNSKEVKKLKMTRKTTNKRKEKGKDHRKHRTHSAVYHMRTNPFVLDVKAGSKRITVLVDTGADVTIMPSNLIISKEHAIEKCNEVAKAANGGIIHMIGRINITLQTEYGNIDVRTYLSDNLRGGYMLLGSDTLRGNSEWFLKLVQKICENNLGNSGDNKINKKQNVTLAVTNSLDEHKSETIENLVKDYEMIFKDDLRDAAPCKVTKHRIITKEDFPIAQKNFSLPFHWEKEINQEINRLIDQDIIQESHSAWASRIVPIRKKDGKLRLCVDYRALNAVTIKDAYPLPRISEILDSMADSAIFSTLDATAGYHQFMIDEKDREKTAFRYKGGLYEFKRMPFGLTNAPATFQRGMDIAFKDYIGKFMFPYLDDMIIYSKNKEDHVKHLKLIFEKIKEIGLKINKSKCRFAQSKIKILGNVISDGQVQPDPERTRQINSYPKPKNIKELRMYLGLINYCREFVPNIAGKLEPLTTLLKGETKRSVKSIIWTPDLDKLFLESRKLLSEQTQRTTPIINKPFILTTDASQQAIGAILTQVGNDGRERMISAWSRVLTNTERNYSTTDKELLAAIKGIEHYRRFLAGSPFVLKTDHQSIKYIQTTKNLEGRMLRWALKLQGYKFTVRYVKGESNGADGLSRIFNINKQHKVPTKEFTPEFSKKLIEEAHILLGHGSAQNMKRFIEPKYLNKETSKAIDERVKTCEICNQAADSRRQYKLKHIEYEKFNECWQIDTIGAIAEEYGERSYIFIAVDMATKWVEAKLLKDKSAKSILECIQELIIAKHGKPKKLWTDSGREFENLLLKTFAREQEIEFSIGSPFYHQSNGTIERCIRSFLSKLRKLTICGKLKMKGCIPKVIDAMNFSFSRSIGMSPYVARFQKYATLPCEGMVTERSKAIKTQIINEWRNRGKNRYKTEIEGKYRETSKPLMVGQNVWIYNGNGSNPLKPRWQRGYKIVEVTPDGSYLLSKNNRTLKRNRKHVKVDLTRSE